MPGWLKLAAALSLAALLAACGQSEGEQRKAFIAFLQEQVLAKPGVRIPKLEAEEAREKYGDNAALFWVITRFHQTMNDSVSKPLQQVIANGAPRTIEDLVQRRKDVEAMRVGITNMRGALDRAEAAAKREKAQLPQPGELLDVYGAAFDRLVTEPAAAFRDVFPSADEGLKSALDLASLIEANRSTIKISGSMIEVKDPAVKAKVDAALAAMQAKHGEMRGAMQRLSAVMRGA